MTIRLPHPPAWRPAALRSAMAPVLLLLAALFLAQPVAAQETTDPSSQITTTDLESLVKTLEDDQGREELVQQLKTLIEAERQAQGAAEEEPEPKSLGVRLLAAVSGKIAAAAERIALLLPALMELPEAAARTWRQARDPSVRAGLLAAIGKLLLIFALALAAMLVGEVWLRRGRQ